jgi:hypothetical protein
MSWADQAARVNAAQLRAFGESLTYISGATESTITGVWSGDEARLPPGIAATVWCLEADLPGGHGKNDSIVRGSVTYRVVEQPGAVVSQRDGSGGITLYLRQVRNAPDA